LRFGYDKRTLMLHHIAAGRGACSPWWRFRV